VTCLNFSFFGLFVFIVSSSFITNFILNGGGLASNSYTNPDFSAKVSPKSTARHSSGQNCQMAEEYAKLGLDSLSQNSKLWREI
jgi:hypothetical protein